jgi:hypothetical protein
MQYLDRENTIGPTSFIHGSSWWRDVAPVFNPRCIPMMTLSCRVAATAIVSLFLMGSAFAESAAPAATPKAEKPRTAASLECSKEADAQNIHGHKLRHKFMSKCKHDAKAGAAKQ